MTKAKKKTNVKADIMDLIRTFISNGLLIFTSAKDGEITPQEISTILREFGDLCYSVANIVDVFALTKESPEGGEKNVQQE